MKKVSSVGIELFQYKMLIVGMVNILVLSTMLGIQGAGYLGVSLALLVFLISFHSLHLSAMVAKYVRGRNARGQYQSSRNFFRGALLYAVITGVLLCVIMILLSSRIGNFLLRDIHIGICLIVVMLILFVQGISEVLSGYLQGMQFYMPVKLFYLVRQITSFAGSIAGMKFLEEYGNKVANLKHNDVVRSVYGAFGSLLGLLTGSVTGLILLLVFCGLLRRELHNTYRKDNARRRESVFGGFRIVLGMRLMQGLRYALLISPFIVDYVLYIVLCKKDGNSSPWIKTGGFLFGEAVPLMVILMLVYVLLNHKNHRQLAGFWKTEAYSQFQEKVFAMFLGVFVLMLPICAAISVMAEPILKCLIKGGSSEGSSILLYMSMEAVLFILVWITLKLLEIWHESVYLYFIAPVSFGIQTAFVVMAFQILELDVTGILLGGLLQATLLLVFFFVKFSRRMRFSGKQFKKLVMATIVALAGALIMLLIYQFAGKKLSPTLAIAVSMVPGFLLYFAAVIVLRIVSDEEAEQMPGGRVFLWLNRMLHR